MELQLLEIKSPQQQIEVEKNETRRREREKKIGGGGSTGARQRWQAVKVAVTL